MEKWSKEEIQIVVVQRGGKDSTLGPKGSHVSAASASAFLNDRLSDLHLNASELPITMT